MHQTNTYTNDFSFRVDELKDREKQPIAKSNESQNLTYIDITVLLFYLILFNFQ